MCTVLGLLSLLDDSVCDSFFTLHKSGAWAPFVLYAERETSLRDIDRHRGTHQVMVTVSCIYPSCYWKHFGTNSMLGTDI